MKSSTVQINPSVKTEPFSLTRSQGERISEVEGLFLSERMRRILDLPVSNDERRSLIKAQFQGK